MSSTRHTTTDCLRQERYASDPAFQDHLKASAVARKCRLITNPVHREICLYLQYMSMQPGGLSVMAADFLTRYSDRLGSRTMRENQTRNTFSADLVRVIRDELNCGDSFLLKGEIDGMRELFASSTEIASMEYQAQHLPSEYPADDFRDWCFAEAQARLEALLVDFCLNPAVTLENPPGWFYELGRSLRDYMTDRQADGRAGKVVTGIGAQINDALDYAWNERCMIHINGISRMGKTYQAQQWCSLYPGRARYIQVPSSNDDTSFFRAIARALGTACGSTMNTTQIKRQVEDAVQDSGVMLVFDEAHFVFSQHKKPRGYPRRINWILTEAVNKGIPVALISTHQFDDYCQNVVESAGWASEQLDGRISYRLDLPAVLSNADLAAIATFNLPTANSLIISGLCAYAQTSGKFIAGIEAVAKRARFLAKNSGRTTPDVNDLEAAMQDVEPSFAQIKAQACTEIPACKPAAKEKKSSCNRTAQPVLMPDSQLAGVN